MYDTQAIDNMQKSNYVGNIDSWKSVMKNGPQVALEAAKNPTKENRELAEIGTYLQKNMAAEELANFKKVQENIGAIARVQGQINRKETDSGKKASKDEIASNIASLNMLLQQREQLGGVKARARYSTEGMFNRGEIVYEEVTTGRRLSDQEVAQTIFNPMADETSSLNTNQQRILSAVLSPRAGVTPLAQLEFLKSDPKSQADAKLVEAYMRKNGLMQQAIDSTSKSVVRDDKASGLGRPRQ
jgi:hypothetical protein